MNTLLGAKLHGHKLSYKSGVKFDVSICFNVLRVPKLTFQVLVSTV